MSCYTRAWGGRARGRSLAKPEAGCSEVDITEYKHISIHGLHHVRWRAQVCGDGDWTLAWGTEKGAGS